MWGQIIGGGLSLLGAASGMQGAKKQKRLNSMNADLIEKENIEETRRLGMEIRESEALGSAISAASGVQMSGSMKAAMDEVKRENKHQLDWLKSSGQQRAKVVKAGGQLQVGQLKTQAALTGIQGFAQLSQGLFSNSQGSGKG